MGRTDEFKRQDYDRDELLYLAIQNYDQSLKKDIREIERILAKTI
jgi:hypothetical protein